MSRRSESSGGFSFLRVLDRATLPPILTLFAGLQALGLGVVVVGHLATLSDPIPGMEDQVTGDFAAFFTGALMLREGRGSELYDLLAQKEVQESFLGEGLPHWQPYLNPPALALGLAPFTVLGYAASFRLFTFAQGLFLLAALCYLVSAIPVLSRSRVWALTAILLTIGYLPVTLTTFGGQNTGFTLALLAGIFAAVRKGKVTLAGSLLGLLTFKPQYTIMVGLVLLARKEVRVVGVAAVAALLHYAVAALACGAGWPSEYLGALAVHGHAEMGENAPWHFSLPAVAYRVIPDAGVWIVAAGSSAAVLALMLATSRRVPTASVRFSAFYGLLVAGTLLVSPHLQYYEAGVLALPVLLGVTSVLETGRVPCLRARILLALGYLSFPIWRLSEVLGFQPLLVLLLAVFVGMWYLANTAKLSSDQALVSETVAFQVGRGSD